MVTIVAVRIFISVFFNGRYHSTSHNTAAITTIMTIIQKKKNISLSKTPKTNIAMIIIKAIRMIRAMAFSRDPRLIDFIAIY
jgi:hypothetical protein